MCSHDCEHILLFLHKYKETKQNKTNKQTEVLLAASKAIRGGTMRAQYEIKAKAANKGKSTVNK